MKYTEETFGLTRDEATDWLVTQAQMLTQLNALYSEVGFEKIGPLRFDNRKQQLVVPSTNAEAEAEVKRWAADADLAPSSVRHERTDRSIASVNRTVDELYAGIEEDVSRGHAALDVTPSGEATVEVLASAPPEVERRARALTQSTDNQSSVVRTSKPFQPEPPVFSCWYHPTRPAGAGRRFCDSMTGGAAFFNSAGVVCTAGFFVASPVVFDAYFLTAGHCAAPGTASSCRAAATPCEDFGPTLNAMYGPGHGGDSGLFRVLPTSPWAAWGQYPGWMNWNPDPPAVPSVSSVWDYAHANAPVGTVTCKNGQTTGSTCGYVSNSNATINQSSGGTSWAMINMLQFSGMCVHGGDSGSPVTHAAAEIAIGIVSTGGCEDGFETGAEPVHRGLASTGTVMLSPGGPIY